MAHRITVGLLVFLRLVFWVLGSALEEVLVRNLHVHVGVGQCLRVGFLKPFPLFLERLQLRVEAHVRLLVQVGLQLEALVVNEPAAAEGLREEHLLRLVRIQLDFYAFLDYH